MSWLLDTDVICQPAKRHGEPRVIAWLEKEQDRCYTSAVVIAQLAYWARTKDGRQRQVLQAWLTRLWMRYTGEFTGLTSPLRMFGLIRSGYSTNPASGCPSKIATSRRLPGGMGLRSRQATIGISSVPVSKYLILSKSSASVINQRSA